MQAGGCNNKTPEKYMEVEMRIYSLIKHFKAVVTCTVVLLMTLLFVTVQPAQAGTGDLTRPSDATSQGKAEEEIIDKDTPDTTSRRILDGSTDPDDVANEEGDTLVIEEGGSISNSVTAIDMFGDHNTVTNKGKITTTGSSSAGILGLGNNNTVNNIGTMEVAERSIGILFLGDNNAINNFGTISLDQGSTGISVSGADNTINHFGTINMKGGGEVSIGIVLAGKDGEKNTINHYGSTIVGDDEDRAISGTGSGEDTVNLFSGSVIIGDINLGAGDDTINAYAGSQTTGDIDFGAGDDLMAVFEGATFNGAIDFGSGDDTLIIHTGNHALTFEDVDDDQERADPENIITDPSLLAVLNGNVLMAVDKTGQAAKGAVLSSFTTGLHGVIRKRLNHFKPALIKLASTRIEPGMLTKPKQPQAWGDMFHSYRKRDEDGRVPGYDHEYNGFTGGFERTYRRLRAGVMGGYSHAVTEADNKSFQTKSNSYFTGVYGQYDFGRFKLAASLIGGYEDHDNDRYVTDNVFGAETARADFGSIFLSPSVTLLAEYTVAHRLLLRPSATVTYSAGWYDDYHESDTTRSNVMVDSRTIQTLNPQLQLAAVYQITEWCEFELSAGGNARYTDDGTFSGNLGGSDFRVAATGDDNVYAAQVGAYLGADVTEQLELYVNAEFTDATGGETRDFFMAGLQFSF